MKLPLLGYLNEARTETSKVTWPTRNQTIRLTIIVLAVSAVVSAYVFGLDLLFQRILTTLVVK